jgi:hypothetical protein
MSEPGVVSSVPVSSHDSVHPGLSSQNEFAQLIADRVGPK